MNKLLLSTITVLALVGCAQMESMKDKVMSTVVSGDLKACPTGKPIGDVKSCGKVWKLASGHASLKKDGTLTADVKGLVLDDASTGKYNGTPDGVDGVAAAVVCGGKMSGQTEVVPLSKTGDATINSKVTVPSDCASPVIVLRERYEGKVSGWLAATKI
jgi:hypothetical protein